MAFLMSADTVLLRLVEDEKAQASLRVAALRQVKHPPMRLLRRLLVEPKIPAKKPVPAKLRAVAALKFAQEWELKKIRKRLKDNGKGMVTNTSDNALGI